MPAQTDCSCATRLRHGMVGGAILDQRQILGQFARIIQCGEYVELFVFVCVASDCDLKEIEREMKIKLFTDNIHWISMSQGIGCD